MSKTIVAFFVILSVVIFAAVAYYLFCVRPLKARAEIKTERIELEDIQISSDAATT